MPFWSCSLCPRLCSLSYGNVCTFATSFARSCAAPIKMIITVWSLLTVLHKLGRSSSTFMVSLVQSWLLLVATSFRYPAKFTFCLAPRLTSPFHREKFKSFLRESIPYVPELSKILSSKKLSKGHASEIFGKLSFLCRTVVWSFRAHAFGTFQTASVREMVVPTSQLKSSVLLLFGCMFCLVALSGQFSRILAHRLSLR